MKKGSSFFDSQCRILLYDVSSNGNMLARSSQYKHDWRLKRTLSVSYDFMIVDDESTLIYRAS